MIVAVAWAADLRGYRLSVFALGVFAGEMSIGWSNDVFDADRDAAAGRTDKPLARGAIGRTPVVVSAVVSLALSIGLCFLVGAWTGVINAVMMAAGWAYNAGLKSTLASGPMYLIGFGGIPALAASTNLVHPVPKPWTVAAAALIGLGGHFANSIPDLAGDKATGVRGLPQRVGTALGERAVRLVAFALLLGASCVIAFAPGAALGWVPVAGLGLATVMMLLGLRATGRWPFVAALGVAATDVVLFVLREAGF